MEEAWIKTIVSQSGYVDFMLHARGSDLFQCLIALCKAASKFWKDEPMKGSRGAFAGGVTEALYDEDNFEQILRKLENFGVIEPKEKK